MLRLYGSRSAVSVTRLTEQPNTERDKAREDHTHEDDALQEAGPVV
jgi:hypothetical protein